MSDYQLNVLHSPTFLLLSCRLKPRERTREKEFKERLRHIPETKRKLLRHQGSGFRIVSQDSLFGGTAGIVNRCWKDNDSWISSQQQIDYQTMTLKLIALQKVLETGILYTLDLNRQWDIFCGPALTKIISMKWILKAHPSFDWILTGYWALFLIISCPFFWSFTCSLESFSFLTFWWIPKNNMK